MAKLGSDYLKAADELGSDYLDSIKPMSKVQLLMQKYGTPIIRGAEIVGGFTPFSPLTTGLGEAAIGYGETGKIAPTLKRGGIAGATDLALMASTMGLSKIPGAKQAIMKGIASTGEQLAGIPKEAYMRVLQNPELLKGKFNAKEAYSGLGKKTSQAVEALEDKLGAAIGKERKPILLGEQPSQTNIGPWAQEQKQMYFPEGGVPAFPSKIEKEVSSVLEGLTPKTIKTESKILSETGKPFITETTKIPTLGDKQRAIMNLDEQLTHTGGDNPTLSQMRHKLNEELRQEAPQLAARNDEYAQMLKDKQMIGSAALGEKNVETLMKNLQSKNLSTQEAMERLSKQTGIPVSDLQKDIWAREFFESIVPAKGYTTGGTQGIGNTLRAAIMSSLGTGTALGALNPATLALATLFSPKAHKMGIKNIPKLFPAARVFAAQQAAEGAE